MAEEIKQAATGLNEEEKKNIIRTVWSWNRNPRSGPLRLGVVPTGESKAHHMGLVVHLERDKVEKLIKTGIWDDSELTEWDINSLKGGLENYPEPSPAPTPSGP